MDSGTGEEMKGFRGWKCGGGNIILYTSVYFLFVGASVGQAYY